MGSGSREVGRGDSRYSQPQIGLGREMWAFLLGFLTENELFPFLDAHGVLVSELDHAVLQAQHREAVEHVSSLGSRAPSKSEPVGEHSHLTAAQAEPTFAEHVANAQFFEFAWVELAGLLVPQPRVRSEHVESLAATVPAKGDIDGLVRFCEPLQAESAPPASTVSFNPITNTQSFVCDNPDVRICGPAHGAQTETGRSLMGFSVGAGLRQMSVIAFDGKLIIANGHHRAVALLKAGHDRAPVLVSTVSEIGATPMVRPSMFNPRTVLGPRAPRLVDFLGPAAVELPCRTMRTVFSVHAEVLVVPA